MSRDIFERFKDSVVFTCLKKDLKTYYFRCKDRYVSIQTNIPEQICKIVDKRAICTNCENEENVIGHISIIYDNNLFIPRYDYSLYNEKEKVSKKHPMYIDGVTNAFFEIANMEVHIYHYPHEIVNILSKKTLEFISFISEKEDFVREALYGIKKVISRYYAQGKVFSLHAAAVSKDTDGYLFLSGSRSGKSSLLINLVAHGYVPINDDIVFWCLQNEKIIISGLKTLPQIRKQSFQSIKNEKKLISDFESDSWVEDFFNSENNHLDDKYKSLKAIFIPEIGYETTSIESVKDESELKKILRACLVHGNYDVDEQFLKAFKILNNYPIYKLKMSNDYNEICWKIDEVIRKQNTQS